jgi:hypothetical protein
MRYDSVLLYADEGQPGFSRFRLPILCPGNPDDEIVRVRVLIGKNGGTMVDDDFTNKEIVDGDEDDVDFFDSRDDAVNDANDADDGSYSEGAPATKKKRKKTGGKRATKRNNTRRLNNTTINPDLVLRSGEGDADGEEGDADGYSGGGDDSDSDNDFFLRTRGTKNRRRKIGRSTPTDDRGGRFIQFLLEGRWRHFAQRYPTRS